MLVLFIWNYSQLPYKIEMLLWSLMIVLSAEISVWLYCWCGGIIVFLKSIVMICLFCLYSYGKWWCTALCQVVYFPLLVVADAAEAETAAWLPKKRGSRQATLAAKNEWMQWRTANRFENSSSWKGKRHGSSKITISFQKTDNN